MQVFGLCKRLCDDHDRVCEVYGLGEIWLSHIFRLWQWPCDDDESASCELGLAINVTRASIYGLFRLSLGLRK